jgi:hypothetical protein
MGVLDRVFSIKSKRSKAALQSNPPAFKPAQSQRFRDDEETATRLLRSSSSRFAIISEIDYTSLPPIRKSITSSFLQRLSHDICSAHPINNVVPFPVLSAEHHRHVKSPRSEYNVKVYRHVETDPVPSNPILPSGSASHNRAPTLPSHRLTPQDQCRLYTLRSDPSILSLAQMYDEHGHLSPPLFSNTPPNQTVTAQAGEGGLTLRDLLGNSTPVKGSDQMLTNSSDSDISWAEKYLE